MKIMQRHEKRSDFEKIQIDKKFLKLFSAIFELELAWHLDQARLLYPQNSNLP